MATVCLIVAAPLLFLALAGFVGRIAVSRGYEAGESGSILELALPLFIRLAPQLLVSSSALIVIAGLTAWLG